MRYGPDMRSKRFRRVARARGFTLLELVIVVGVIIVLMSLVLGVGSIVVAQSENRQLNAVMTIVDSAIAEFEAQTGRPIVFQGQSSSSRYDHCGHAADRYDNLGDAGFYYDVPYFPYRDDRFTLGLDDGGFGWAEIGVCPPWEDNTSYIRRQWLAATLAVLTQNPACAEILAKGDPALLHNVQCIIGSDGRLRALNIQEFADPWGNQVYIVFPGRKFAPRDASSTAGLPDQEGVRDLDGTIRTYEELQFGICRNGRPMLVSAGPDGRFGNLREEDAGADDFAFAQDNVYSYEPAQNDTVQP